MSSSKSLDALVAESVARFRGVRMMSQLALAEAMRARGFDFYQQTIGKIERGERRVTIGEAFGLADALGVDLTELVEQDENQSTAQVMDAHALVSASQKRLEGATDDFLVDWTRLARELERLRKYVDETPEDDSVSSAARNYLRVMLERELPARERSIAAIIGRLHDEILDL